MNIDINQPVLPMLVLKLAGLHSLDSNIEEWNEVLTRALP
jgi:hypothetical protein